MDSASTRRASGIIAASRWTSRRTTPISRFRLLSSSGYGIFWNNASRRRFNNRFVHSLYISSEVADTIDYYFIYGPDFDKIVAGYRELTGAAPLFGKWAYGFWQCKNHYKSQEELLGVAHKYRELHIPVDNIVQDWFWWTNKGEFVFNKNYPDPKGMVDDLHRQQFPPDDFRVAVFRSRLGHVTPTWTSAATSSTAPKSPSFHPQGMAVYDATNPEAPQLLLEPDGQSAVQDRRRRLVAGYRPSRKPRAAKKTSCSAHKLAIGSGARYANILSADDHRRRLRRPAQRERPEARLHSLALRFCRQRSAMRSRRGRATFSPIG